MAVVDGDMYMGIQQVCIKCPFLSVILTLKQRWLSGSMATFLTIVLTLGNGVIS